MPQRNRRRRVFQRATPAGRLAAPPGLAGVFRPPGAARRAGFYL